MPFTVRFLGFSFDISELESYLTNKFNHLEENVMTALTETKQGLATILASLDTLFETIASESQQIQDKIDSLSVSDEEKAEITAMIANIQERLAQANTAVAGFVEDTSMVEEPDIPTEEPMPSDS